MFADSKLHFAQNSLADSKLHFAQNSLAIKGTNLTLIFRLGTKSNLLIGEHIM